MNVDYYYHGQPRTNLRVMLVVADAVVVVVVFVFDGFAAATVGAVVGAAVFAFETGVAAVAVAKSELQSRRMDRVDLPVMKDGWRCFYYCYY